MENEKKRFPIGKFEYGKKYSTDQTRKNIKDIAKVPKQLKKILKKISGDDYDLAYRKGGWTARQVIHHMADSHMHAYLRMKFTVVEDNPVIKPYQEDDWANLEDSKGGSVKLSSRLLAALHKRWVAFLSTLSEEVFNRTYHHPGYNRDFTLSEAIALYAWHGKHHLGHLKIVADGEGVKSEKAAESKAKPATAYKTEIAKTGSAMAAETGIAEPQKAKRTRRTKAEMEAAAKKTTPEPVAKPETNPEASPGKRHRRTKAEMEAHRAQVQANPKPLLSKEEKKERQREIIAKARTARLTKLAAAENTKPAKPKVAPKPKPEPKAKPAPKPLLSDEERKAIRAENMAKARAARKPKEPKAEVQKQPKAPKAPKPAKPLRSEAEMKAIRQINIGKAIAARAAKRLAEGKTPKPKAEPTPKLSPEDLKAKRIQALASARAAKQANMIAAGKTPKPKTEPAPKRSPEELMAIRSVNIAKAQAARKAKLESSAKDKPIMPEPKPPKTEEEKKAARNEALGKARAAKKAKSGN